MYESRGCSKAHLEEIRSCSRRTCTRLRRLHRVGRLRRWCRRCLHRRQCPPVHCQERLLTVKLFRNRRAELSFDRTAFTVVIQLLVFHETSGTTDLERLPLPFLFVVSVPFVQPFTACYIYLPHFQILPASEMTYRVAQKVTLLKNRY